MSTSRKDADWIGRTLEQYERPLIRYAFRMTGDPEVARDVVQDAFMKLCAAKTSDIERHVVPWLYTVVRNRVLDVSKKQRRMTRWNEGHEPVDDRASPAEMASRREVRRIVLEVLDGLSEREREVFRLKFEDQLSYREISQITGMSLGTVSRAIASALVAVRDALKKQGALMQEDGEHGSQL